MEHIGQIIEIEDDRIDVVIEAQSACSSCHVKSACGMGDSKEKIISVRVEFPEAFEIGEQVDVLISQGMGMKAVTLAYMIPFFILLGSLLIMIELELGEVIAGLGALGLTAVYYVALYFNRDRIEREIIFKIRKQ